MTNHREHDSLDLERGEFHLSIFAGSAILVLAAGMALLMYPAVFSNKAISPTRAPQIAFFGFCALSCLLVAYIVDRQFTVRRLRRQLTMDRKKASEALLQASADLLATLPNFGAFEDRLAMEFRRAAVAELTLSVLAVAIHVPGASTDAGLELPVLGDAAKVICRKLREQDSVYILKTGFFAVILPGVSLQAAQRVSARLSEGLSDAAGVNDRFSFKIDSINYPEQTSSVHDLELAVCGWVPDYVSTQNALKEAPAFK